MLITYSKMLKDAKQAIEKRDPNFERIFRLMSVTFCPMDGQVKSEEELIALYQSKTQYGYVESERIKGCLVGGAVGDALGYAVEFLQKEYIFEKYGKSGIRDYELRDGVAEISDDTQMTLFTAEGLLNAKKAYGEPTCDQYVHEIYKSYLNWLHTQGEYEKVGGSELLKEDKLFARRAPGMTCINALRSKICGTYETKLNHSKGCGGIMRVAPIALFMTQLTRFDEYKEIADLGARASAITHSHELGYIPSALLTAFIAGILRGMSPIQALHRAKVSASELFGENAQLEFCLELVERAISLALPDEDEEKLSDIEAIECLGEGWVAEETLAIALYCCFRHMGDENAFENAIASAVNHSGDSDSTGAVAGNIMGALLGIQSIPDKYIKNLELANVVLDMADKLQLHRLDTEIQA